MSQDLTPLYKLNTMILSDVLPDSADVLYLSAQPDGWLKDRQIAHGARLASKVRRVALCGGTGQGYKGFIPWSEALQAQGVPAEKIVAVPYGDSLNTYTESVHLVRFAREQGWSTLLLSSLPHHQLRVFLTLLDQIQTQQSATLRVYCAPSQAIPWWEEVTHYQGEVTMIGHHFIDAELERIGRYQAMGHLASTEAGLAYLRQRDTAR